MVGGYAFVITMTSVIYHRALTHRALALAPWLHRLVAYGGVWMTAMDPKTWICMHRRHHAYSDGPEDPHSPVRGGILRVLLKQTRSYEETMQGLVRGDEKYLRFVTDLDFPVSWISRKGLWFFPYLLHASMGLLLVWALGTWWAAPAWLMGFLSHPFQGWAVNALGHARGGRTFALADNSRNNLPVAWLVFGEGLQNNHHAWPGSARFSYLPHEPDLGWRVSQLLAKLGWLSINESGLIGSPSAHRSRV